MFWPTIDLLPRLPSEVPVLLISGERDNLVPPAMMRQLEAAARSRKPATAGASADGPAGGSSGGGSGNLDGDSVHFYLVPGGTHDDCAVKGGAEYVHTIRRFMDTALIKRLGAAEGLASGGSPRPVRIPPGVPPHIVPGASLGSAPVGAAPSSAAASGGQGRRQVTSSSSSLAGVGVPVAFSGNSAADSMPEEERRMLSGNIDLDLEPEVAGETDATGPGSPAASAGMISSDWELLGEDGSEVIETLKGEASRQQQQGQDAGSVRRRGRGDEAAKAEL